MPVLLLTGIIALATSVFSTVLVDQYLLERISFIGSLIGFERTTNAGIAFGIDIPAGILAILIPVALILIMHLAWKMKDQKIPAVSFGLILGGAFGNIIDRLGDGFVTDFIQIGIWPTFNIADSCITVGVLLLVLMEYKKAHTGLKKP
jgi:signal peptidase II